VIIGLSAPNRTPEAGAVQTIFIKMSPAADTADNAAFNEVIKSIRFD
jgi:hypothetical protein